MIDINLFSDILTRNGVEFISGVPDTLLNDFCLFIEKEWPHEKHIIAANEGNAIALAAGYHLATGTIPLVYMQNSGIGNAVNPLISLTHGNVYSIPLVLLIGWRGDPSARDHVQHIKQGELTPKFMDEMDIPYRVLENDKESALNNIEWAVNNARKLSAPTALIVKKGVLEKGGKDAFNNEDNTLLSREEAINCVLNTIPHDSIVVASTGRATRELYELRNIRKEKHNYDFLNVGAMGHTSSIATGLSLGTKQTVVCLEGDSSAIMHLGAFTTTGGIKPKNILHVVLNNGVHESVGGQQSAGFSANLTDIATNSGYKTMGKAFKNVDDIKQAVEDILKNEGPSFIEIIIRKGIRADMPQLKFDLKETKKKLMKSLQPNKSDIHD